MWKKTIPVLLLCGLSFAAIAQTYGPYFRWPLANRTPINSFFDNDNSADGYLTRFDHRMGGSVSVNNCTLRFSCYDHHEGIDLQANYGERILAAAAGSIICKQNPASGLTRLSILHNNGFVTDYLHMQSFALKPGTTREWAVGDVVAEGNFIAEVGDRGAPGQPHLHFGVRKPVTGDPCNYTWTNFVDPLGKLYQYAGFFKTGVQVEVNSIGFVEMAPVGDPLKVSADGTNAHSLYTYANQTDESRYNGGLWNAAITQRGFYSVRAYIPGYASAKVKYQVYYSDYRSYNRTSSIVEIDQLNRRNQWVDLGTYFFIENQPAAVLLTDMKADGRSATDIVAFDEIQWAFQSPDYSATTISGNQASVNVSVPQNQVLTYTAPNYINADNTYVPLYSTLIFSSSGTISLRPGFHAAGGVFIASTATGSVPAPAVSGSAIAVESGLSAPVTSPKTANAFPNPFRNGITIALPPGKQFRKAIVYQANGSRVAEITAKIPGNTIRWNGQNAGGRPVAAGLYLVEIEYLGFAAETIKMVKE